MKLSPDRWGFVFDFDGVIANTLEALYEVYDAFLQDYGFRGNRAEFDHLNGPKLPQIIAYLKQTYNLEQTPEALENTYRERLTHLYENAYPNEGVADLLKDLRQQAYPILIASACSRNEIIGFLKRHQLLDYFDHIVSGDDVKVAKPAPDIYFQAQSHYPHHHLVVIEDSPNGLQSALAAGLLTIHYNSDSATASNLAALTLSSMRKFHSLMFSSTGAVIPVVQTDKIEVIYSGKLEWDDASLDEVVTTLWQRDSVQKGLFDSRILCYCAHAVEENGLKIYSKDIPYRYVYAQKCGVSLPFLIKPLAVSGLILDKDDNVLIGKRGAVTEHQSRWELVPSGGMDITNVNGGNGDWKAQIEQEFAEETGLEREDILDMTPIGLFLCTESLVYDIGVQIRLKTALASLQPNREYSEFKILPKLLELNASADLIDVSQALLHYSNIKTLL